MKTLLKNVILVESKHPLNGNVVDIFLSDGVIKSIDYNLDINADQIIDYQGQVYASAGWIDIHVHCFEDISFNGVDADRIGVETGVVCVVDAGSSGTDNVDILYEQAQSKRTIVKSWLNIAATGLVTKHELKDPTQIRIDEIMNKSKKYHDFIVGYKLRASASVMGEDQTTPFEKLKELQTKLPLPVMVHIGNTPPSLNTILGYLGKGDVITHCFHGKEGNTVIENNEIRPLVIQKRNDGVYYDVGHGEASFSYDVGQQAKELGFEPDSISTDLHVRNLNGPVYSLANCMNKFLELGYTLEQVVNWVTKGPAEIINCQSEFGKLEVDKPAHLTLFKVDNEQKTLVDSEGKNIDVHSVIKTVGSFINGKFELVKYEN